MLKILGRIVVILLVTGLLTGGLYLLVEQTGLGSSDLASETHFEGERPARPEGLEGEHAERGGHGESEFSLSRGLGEVAVTLVKFGVVTMLVLALQKLLSKAPRFARPA